MIFPHLEMLKEIDALLETDLMFEMIDCKRMPHAKPYTQKEAEEMSDVLGKIYLIAHCIHCKACGTKYGIGDTPSHLVPH